MIMKKLSLQILVFAIALGVFTQSSIEHANANDENEPRKAIGLKAGFYSPSFSFFDQSFWNFSNPTPFGVEFDYHINRFLFIKTGVDFYSSEAEVIRPELEWQEKIEFEFIPVHFSLLAKYDFEYVEAFAGPGLEFISIATTYTSPNRTEFKSGYTSVFTINAGVERRFGDFALSLHSKYTLGEFRQRMDVGSNLQRNNEISLNGLHIGTTVKYLF